MHVKCLPDARVSLLVSDDGTLRASAQHLLENFMRFASAGPPPYRPLGCCLARKEISRTMRNNLPPARTDVEMGEEEEAEVEGGGAENFSVTREYFRCVLTGEKGQ